MATERKERLAQNEALFRVANPERGPMLIVAAEKDHTVPHAIANASFKGEKHNEGVTEVFEFEGRGHSLCIDHGWRDVCDKALEFVKRYV